MTLYREDIEVNEVNGVNKTLYIPLYGKAKVSKKGIILSDAMAERIWEQEGFPIRGKAKSRWLTYNMAMRARIFDDWTEEMLRRYPDALVLHIGCGLDGRCLRVKAPYSLWIDGDFEDVIALRRRYYTEHARYRMLPLDASRPEQTQALPDSDRVIIVLEGISMYLKSEELNAFFRAIKSKYGRANVLMDAYTVFGARASRYKNPIQTVGVTQVWGMDSAEAVLHGTGFACVKEHSMTPQKLVDELTPWERRLFRLLFVNAFYGKIYRLYELEA